MKRSRRNHGAAFKAQVEEAMKKTVLAKLAAMDALARVTSLDAKRLERMLLGRVADVKALLGRHVPQARQMLRKLLLVEEVEEKLKDGTLLDGRIVCTPFQDARGRGYELTATGTYGGLLSDKLMVKHRGGEGGILNPRSAFRTTVFET